MESRINNYKKVEIVLFSAYYILLIAAVFFGILNFNFMPQAKVLLDDNNNLLYWFRSGHMHAVRLLIAYPGYILSTLFKCDLNVGYGYYSITIMWLLALIVYKISKFYCTKNRYYIVNLITILLWNFMLSMVMNGRINFAFLGISISIYYSTLMKKNIRIKKYKQLCMILIGFLLSTVSSGTMIVVSFYLLVVILLNINKEIALFNIKFICLFFPLTLILGYPIIKYIVMMIRKNIVYFGGIINMLQHGVGRVLPMYNSVVTILVVSIAVEILLLNYFIVIKLLKNDIFELILASNIALYGSLFGISTGTLILVPIIVLILVFIDRKIIITFMKDVEANE